MPRGRLRGGDLSARGGRRELGLQVIGELSMCTEPDIVECSDIGQKPVDHSEPGAVSADVWVQSQFEDSSSCVRCVEFVDPYAFDVARREMRAQSPEAIHHKVRSVISDPFDWDFDDPGRFAIGIEFVGFVIGHERRIVCEPELSDDFQRGL